jgi:predicted nucleic acid-binding protein
VAYVVLDSTFVIDCMLGDPAALARLEQVFAEGQQPMVNEVVVCEVRAGLREPDVAAFEALLEPTEFVQPGPDVAVKAGAWRADLRQRGRVLSLADALIGAAADAAGATVLTRNMRDFQLMPIRVESY